MKFEGTFRNIEEGYGYTLTQIEYRPGWYQYNSIPEHPLYFQHTDGSRWQMPEKCDTDFGSVPRAFRWAINEKEYPLAYFFHDAATSKEVGRCLFRQMPGALPHKVHFKRGDADSMLYDLVRASGGSWLHAQQIYAGVRAWAIVSLQCWPFR